MILYAALPLNASLAYVLIVLSDFRGACYIFSYMDWSFLLIVVLLGRSFLIVSFVLYFLVVVDLELCF